MISVILQNGSNVALRQAIVRREMGEFEGGNQSMAAPGMDILKVEGDGVRSLFAVPAEAGLCRQVAEARAGAEFIRNGTRSVNPESRDSVERANAQDQVSNEHLRLGRTT